MASGTNVVQVIPLKACWTPTTKLLKKSLELTKNSGSNSSTTSSLLLAQVQQLPLQLLTALLHHLHTTTIPTFFSTLSKFHPLHSHAAPPMFTTATAVSKQTLNYKVIKLSTHSSCSSEPAQGLVAWVELVTDTYDTGMISWFLAFSISFILLTPFSLLTPNSHFHIHYGWLALFLLGLGLWSPYKVLE